MSSSGVEDLHPHGGPMSSRRGGIPPLKIPSEPRDLASLGWNWKETIPVFEGELFMPDQHKSYLKNDQIGPKPAGECTRMTRIELCGSKSMTRRPHGVTYIFVQGKESACIVSRDLGKEQKIHDLRFDLFGWTAGRYRGASVRGRVSKRPPDMYPFAVVSVLLNTDYPSGEKESKPDSSHKDSSSRTVNEQGAITFLKQKLENNDTYEETIQTAISALQCLYQESVNANEIEGYTAEVGRIGRYLPREEIELHLSVINNGCAY